MGADEAAEEDNAQVAVVQVASVNLAAAKAALVRAETVAAVAAVNVAQAVATVHAAKRQLKHICYGALADINWRA